MDHSNTLQAPVGYGLHFGWHRAWEFLPEVQKERACMSLDINKEVAKSGHIMSRYRMAEADQIEVVRILLAAGVEHCLNEQQRLLGEKDAAINTAFSGARIVH